MSGPGLLHALGGMANAMVNCWLVFLMLLGTVPPFFASAYEFCVNGFFEGLCLVKQVRYFCVVL